MCKALQRFDSIESAFDERQAKNSDSTRLVVKLRLTLAQFEKSGELKRIKRLQLGVCSQIEECRP